MFGASETIKSSLVAKYAELRQCATFIKRIREGDLAGCQFPRTVTDRNGMSPKPVGWRTSNQLEARTDDLGNDVQIREPLPCGIPIPKFPECFVEF